MRAYYKIFFLWLAQLSSSRGLQLQAGAQLQQIKLVVGTSIEELYQILIVPTNYRFLAALIHRNNIEDIMSKGLQKWLDAYLCILSSH